MAREARPTLELRSRLGARCTAITRGANPVEHSISSITPVSRSLASNEVCVVVALGRVATLHLGVALPTLPAAPHSRADLRRDPVTVRVKPPSGTL